jgi:hypothetical protein
LTTSYHYPVASRIGVQGEMTDICGPVVLLALANLTQEIDMLANFLSFYKSLRVSVLLKAANMPFRSLWQLHLYDYVGASSYLACRSIDFEDGIK